MSSRGDDRSHRRGGGGFEERNRSATLFVRNVTERDRYEDIKKLFERYGTVVDVTIPLDYYSRIPKGFCFVEYEDPRDAEDAFYHMDKLRLNGRDLEIEFARGERKTPADMRSRDRGGDRRYEYGGGGRGRRRSRSSSEDRRRRRRSNSKGRRRRPSFSRSRSPVERKRSFSGGRRGHSSERSRSPVAKRYSPVSRKQQHDRVSPIADNGGGGGSVIRSSRVDKDRGYRDVRSTSTDR
ncbi:hypothetical protein ACOME3_003380 [Neoechinorhynchus agilis]